MDKEQATNDLQDILNAFNDNFRDWEELHNCRANFRFKYEEGSGRKILEISDIEEANFLPISLEQLQGAEETIDEALQNVLNETQGIDTPTFTPPEIANDIKFPELAPVTEALENGLSTKVRAAVSQTLMGLVGENDLLLLSALGIDGRQKILDVFIEECGTLKEEFAYATRTGGSP